MRSAQVLACLVALTSSAFVSAYPRPQLKSRDTHIHVLDVSISAIEDLGVHVVDQQHSRRDSSDQTSTTPSSSEQRRDIASVAIDAPIDIVIPIDIDIIEKHRRQEDDASHAENHKADRRDTSSSNKTIPDTGLGYNWGCTTVAGPDPMDCPPAIGQWQNLTNTGEIGTVSVQGGRCVTINRGTCMAFACAPKEDIVVSSAMVSGRLMNPSQVRCVVNGHGGVWSNAAGNDTTLKVGLLVNAFQDLPY
ncbi:hypothetical protein BROUX41_004762 [Berkeleyomyces rouxiae]